jgi:hypothetical protein
MSLGLGKIGSVNETYILGPDVYSAYEAVVAYDAV